MKNTLFIVAAITLLSLASCNSANTNTGSAPKADSAATKMESKQDRNKKVLMAAVEAFNAHDADKVVKDYAPNMVDNMDGAVPPAKGDSAKMMLKEYLNTFPDMKSDNAMYFADGDNVVVIADWTMTFKNDMMGMKATGKSTKYKECDIFTFDDNGKIVSHRSIYPIGALMMQMGCDVEKEMAKAEKKGGDKKK